jgi:predicted RNA-binding protein with PIN domain
MAYLIDGNNLLGRIAPHELRERGGREGLVVRLLAFQRVTRTRIHLVFDGSPEPDPVADVLNPKFTVHYPGRGQSADDVIAGLIERQTDRRNFFVVSSDRAIRGLAKDRGLRPVTSDEFARAVKRALKERRDQRAMEKKVEDASPLEVDLWGEVFRSKP